jgi:hypothetical protein
MEVFGKEEENSALLTRLGLPDEAPPCERLHVGAGVLGIA